MIFITHPWWSILALGIVYTEIIYIWRLCLSSSIEINCESADMKLTSMLLGFLLSGLTIGILYQMIKSSKEFWNAIVVLGWCSLVLILIIAFFLANMHLADWIESIKKKRELKVRALNKHKKRRVKNGK
jgi:hypothetical protein